MITLLEKIVIFDSYNSIKNKLFKSREETVVKLNSGGLTMRNITEPYQGAFQVRLVTNRKEVSKLFTTKLWGGRKKALIAANSWREQMIVVLGIKPNRRTCVSKNNLSTGIQGISRTIQTDNRKNLKYLVFQVNWRDETGKKRNKSFNVGNAETYEKSLEKKAFKAAKKFREDYEKHWDNNQLHLFDPKNYQDWRSWD